MPEPTPNCPDPEAPDFLRCLKAWEVREGQTFKLPFVVIYRCCDNDGNVDEDALALAVKVRKNRPSGKPKVEVELELDKDKLRST